MENTTNNKPALKIMGNNEFIEEVIKKASIEELYWLHGLLSGIIGTRTQQIAQTGTTTVSPPTTSPAGATVLVEEMLTVTTTETYTVLFATQSGNSRKVAKMLEAKANENNIAVNVLDIADFPPHQIKKEKNLIIICSTQGEGDPPLSAEEFYAYIHSNKVGKLDHLQYAVLALGDKSYVNFCKTGKDIDNRLHALGAKRIISRADCDVNFKPTAEKWINELISTLIEKNNRPQVSSATTYATSSKSTAAEVRNIDIFTREQPGTLVVSDIIHLNGRGSTKDTLHVELIDEKQQIIYQPGDSLGIYFRNASSLVDDILSYLKIDSKEMIIYQNVQLSVRECLEQKTELTLLNREFLGKLAEVARKEELNTIINDNAKLSEFIYGRDVLDVLQEFKVKLKAQQLVDMLYPIQPRLYSIASSPLYQEGEVHLTIGKLQYQFNGRPKTGMCSGFVANDLKGGDVITAFVHENESFRLPSDEAPIIMIGQGTGIAPYRAFMQDIEANGRHNKTWLFFGNPHFTTDFLYQTDWQQWYKKKLLTRIDLAWSRDQSEKIYVQHRLRQKAREVFEWIDDGAHIYLCGGKKMGKDVQDTLLNIIQEAKNISNDQAKEYLKNIKRQHRYHEDLY
ncbi:MAG TPA: flavodoxin domain-containing protein [Bacteroidales bacterium]|nr:flavodoxin domain-containing protein [Bacteroidales bacterium]HPO64630.1 flavodoxin domain-containing protein [Bacteroidales bacterium]